jgi:GH24 family phage-related lysozyme (muramidase)
MTRIAPGASPPNQTSIDEFQGTGTLAAANANGAVHERSSRRPAGGGDAIPDQPALRAPGTARPTADARTLCVELIKWEGCCQHMYVDTRGHVTTGIGHLLPNADAALALPWCHRATGLPATPAEIRAAFAHVREQGPGLKSLAYRLASDLVLPGGVAADLAATRLEREFLPGLRRLCPSFDNYPMPAQRALVDMAYNLGVGGLGKFHNLLAACERGDFSAAAENCHRRTSREIRNASTRNLFLDAAELTTAMDVRARGARS